VTAGLEVAGLTVRIGSRTVLDGVSFAVPDGARVGVIGASGSGKSMTALAIMGLTPPDAVVTGSVRVDGTELIGMTDRQRARFRGSRVGMVFQEPGTALDPLRRVGRQIEEPLRLHRGLRGAEARAAAVGLADAVGLPGPESMLRQYPHQLSGGQRQRVCIAMAIAGEPGTILADEPTTALDVTTEARVLDLLAAIVRERDVGLLFVTHDLAVLARIADTAVVLDDGRVVDGGPVSSLLSEPRHPTTVALVEAARATARRVP
jgi:peptide/nickel transport system ATP-binding protein